VLSTWQYDRYMASEWFYRPVIWANSGWTFSIYTRYGIGRMFFDRPAVFVTFKGVHSHRGNSFYSGHHFDRPNPPKGHGNHNNNNIHNNHNNHNNGNLSHNGHSNWNHNGNRPPMGNGNHNSVGTGNSHRSTSANTPTRVFGSRPSGSVANSGNSKAPHGTFGGGARR
jgi:hypothetical protein